MRAPENMIEILAEVAASEASLVDFGVTNGVHVHCRGEEVELELNGSGSEVAWYLAKGSA
jgi:hypothetical protein